MLQVTTYGWNVGAQQQQQVCTTLSVIFLFLHFSLHLFVSQKSLNDKERGGNCLLVPECSYGPVSSGSLTNYVSSVTNNTRIYYDTTTVTCPRLRP